MAYDFKSDQVTTADNTDNVYLSESDKLGRVRGVAFKFTADAAVSVAKTVELCRLKATRAVGLSSISNTARASATIKIGHGTIGTGTATITDDDSFTGGTTVSLAAATVKDLTLHDGTAPVAYLDLPSTEIALVGTIGGAALQSGDVVQGIVYVID